MPSIISGVSPLRAGRKIRALLSLLFVMLGIALPGAAAADAKSMDERIADLEAYMNNGARVAKESKVAGPGPGHNGWMMVCAALVLFMTLPGLALFWAGWCAPRMCCRSWRN